VFEDSWANVENEEINKIKRAIFFMSLCEIVRANTTHKDKAYREKTLAVL
jgi:hypothetical protein